MSVEIEVGLENAAKIKVPQTETQRLDLGPDKQVSSNLAIISPQWIRRGPPWPWRKAKRVLRAWMFHALAKVPPATRRARRPNFPARERTCCARKRLTMKRKPPISPGHRPWSTRAAPTQSSRKPIWAAMDR